MIRHFRASCGATRLASAFGITIYTGQPSDWDGWVDFGNRSFDPLKRAVRFDRHELDPVRVALHDAFLAHEVTHVITAFPFGHWWNLPEELFQLAIDYAAVDLAGLSLAAVDRYMESTTLSSLGHDRKDYEWADLSRAKRDRLLEEARRRARDVGLLDQNNRLIQGQFPDWSKLARKDRRLFLSYV